MGSLFLYSALLEWFGAYSLRDKADATDPDASPLEADDLGGLPPADGIAAENDPHRIQGRVDTDALEEAGIEYRLSTGWPTNSSAWSPLSTSPTRRSSAWRSA